MGISSVGFSYSPSWIYGGDNVLNSDELERPFNDFTQSDNRGCIACDNSSSLRRDKSLVMLFINDYNAKAKALSQDENYFLTHEHTLSLGELCEEINKKLICYQDNKILVDTLNSVFKQRGELSKYLVLMKGFPYRVEPRHIASEIISEQIESAIELLVFVAKYYPKIAKKSTKLLQCRPHVNRGFDVLNDYLCQLKKILSGKTVLSNRMQRSLSVHFNDAWGDRNKIGLSEMPENIKLHEKVKGILSAFTQRTIASETVSFNLSQHRMVENKLIYLVSMVSELNKLTTSIDDENLKYGINKVVGNVVELKLKKIQQMAKKAKLNFSLETAKRKFLMLGSVMPTLAAAGFVPAAVGSGLAAIPILIILALGCAIYAFNPKLQETDVSKLLDASLKDVGATLGSELRNETLGRFEYLRHIIAAYQYRKAARCASDG